jgi:hypothetical protein
MNTCACDDSRRPSAVTCGFQRFWRETSKGLFPHRPLTYLLSLITGAMLTAQAQTSALQPDARGWTPLFDGKTLSGWKLMDEGRWHITPEGILVGEGPMGHLFSPQTYTNLEFKAEVRLNNRGNSGMYFRAALAPGWPKGYEVQVENTSPDAQKTGSLYNLAKVTEQLIPDDTWWTQHIIAVSNRTIVKVNGKVVVDFVDAKKSFISGHLALQQHNDGSVVQYRNLMVKPLPDDEHAAWERVYLDSPELRPKPN